MMGILVRIGVYRMVQSGGLSHCQHRKQEAKQKKRLEPPGITSAAILLPVHAFQQELT